jgi:30S ribosomal protein S31
MGKGDRRTRRGKIFRGSHGKRRPKVTKRTKPRPAAASASA